jgi:hypothetical protein
MLPASILYSCNIYRLYHIAKTKTEVENSVQFYKFNLSTDVPTGAAPPNEDTSQDLKSHDAAGVFDKLDPDVAQGDGN